MHIHIHILNIYIPFSKKAIHIIIMSSIVTDNDVMSGTSKSPKNNNIDDNLSDWETSVAPENFKTLLLTWNTHGESFDDINKNDENIVEQVFNEGYSSERNGDMVIVSLQEIVELDLDHILYDSNNDIQKQTKSWTDYILNVMNKHVGDETDELEKYIVLTNRAVVGTYLLILIKQKHSEFVKEIENEDIRLQRYLGGTVRLGNKACILTRFTLYGQSFSICSTHLAAHRPNNQERIDQFETIFNEAWTSPTFVYGKKINRHDHCFFIGDLNSRIVERFDTKTAYDLAGNGTLGQDDILAKLNKLSKQDQLYCLMNGVTGKKETIIDNEENREKAVETIPTTTTNDDDDNNNNNDNNVNNNKEDKNNHQQKYIQYLLKDWKEKELTFCPTYKLNLKTWDEKKGYKVDKKDFNKYAPSWTDRILHKCLDAACHENIYYKSFELEKPVSDHFPVQSIIDLKMKKYIKTKLELERTRLKSMSETDMKSSLMSIGNIDWGYFNFCKGGRDGITGDADDDDDNDNNNVTKGKPQVV